MGHKKLWDIKTERERIYALEEMSEEESDKVANLEIEFSELNGYTAEADANKLPLGLEYQWSFMIKNEHVSTWTEIKSPACSGFIWRS